MESTVKRGLQHNSTVPGALRMMRYIYAHKKSVAAMLTIFVVMTFAMVSVDLRFSILMYVDYLVVAPLLERIALESLYFIPSLFIALIFLYIKKRGLSLRRINAAFFTSRIWSSKSAKADYFSVVVNSVILGSITLILESILTGGAAEIARNISAYLMDSLGNIEPVRFPVAASVAASFAIYFVLDFYFYWYHRWLHSGGFAWKLHSRHHSANVLTPLTNFRGHPIEAVLRAPLIFVISATIAGIADYFSGGEASEIVLLGTNLFAFAVLFIGGSLIHTHIFLRFPRWMSHIIVSPAMHQVHHSNKPEHHNKNFASTFAFWDWMFGSLYLPEKHEKVQFGLGEEAKSQHGWTEFMLGKRFSGWFDDNIKKSS